MNEAQRRHYLQDMADHGDRHFDPEAGLLRLPMDGYRNVHTEHLDATPRHPVRESLNYALALLELSDRSLQGRAEAITGRVIALQNAGDRKARTYGLWPYFMEEAVPVWPRPDFDWADFNGMTLLFIRHRHARRLSAPLVKEIERAITRAALCIRRRNADLSDSNIAMKGTFVMLSAAEVTDDADLRAYAMDRLGRLRDTVLSAERLAGQNASARAAAGLAGLHAVDTYVKDAKARAMVGPMLERLWREVTGMDEKCGLLGPLIEKAGQDAGNCPSDGGAGAFDALDACVLNVDVPGGVIAVGARRTRTAAETAAPGHEPAATNADQEPRLYPLAQS